MSHQSLYLPSAEISNMDSSIIITREDLHRLSDGKIMSALLPKNSLIIDSVLGEGKLCCILLSTYQHVSINLLLYVDVVC